MKKLVTTGIFLFFVLNIGQLPAQISKNQVAQKERLEIEKINNRISSFYTREMADSISGLFGKDFFYLPEYRPAITDHAALLKFFKDWFGSVKIKSYEKKVYEVLVISDYILETGSLTLQYQTSLNQAAAYSAKYLLMWKRNAGKLTIQSEIFGSDKWIEKEQIPYSEVTVKDNTFLDNNTISSNIRPEIEAYDSRVVKAVIEGDGNARADGFSRDGIYWPHFDKMQAGMDMIRPYMLNTYKPGVFTYVVDTFHEVFAIGEFVFFDGAFNVGAEKEGRKSGFRGKMCNLMKRDRDGRLLMYRQLANNN